MENKKTFAVEVVLYKPELADIEKVNNYVNDFDRVIIFDNTEDNSDYVRFIKKDKRLMYIYKASNMGLSYAYNYVLNSTYIENIDYLCTMDQDSVFESEEIVKMKNFIGMSEFDNVAIFAPSVTFRGGKNLSHTNNEYSYVDWVISSGSFINLSVINSENIRFDENYFIDRVDIDFCKQVKLMGYEIIIYNKSTLRQSLGSLSKSGVIQHSALRCYYIARNRLYYNKKYYNKFNFYILSLLQFINNMFKILLFEDDKYKKIKYTYYGIRDFRYMKFGKFVR
jgi:rhamnosyltransferase